MNKGVYGSNAVWLYAAVLTNSGFTVMVVNGEREDQAHLRARRAIIEILYQTLIAIAILASISLIRYLCSGVVFFHGSRYLELPIDWIFDAGHIGLLVAFLLRSIWVFLREYGHGADR